MKRFNDRMIKSDSGVFMLEDGTYNFAENFNNGVVKCENGKYSYNRGGLWFRCDKSYAIKIMNAEMGYKPSKSQQIPGRAKQLGE